MLTTGNKSKSQQGLTLIELSLVAVIIVILVSVSTPLFRRTFSDIQFNETSYNIVKLMDYARAMAIAERINTKINFDFELSKYWLTVNTDQERPDYFERIQGRFGRLYNIPNEIEVEGENSGLVFYPNGRSGDFKLYLKNKNGKTRLIEVKKETGKASASDYKE